LTERPVVDSAFDEWGWESHEKAQRRRFARMPLATKIAWLEEAQRMVLLLERQRSTVNDRVAEDDAKDTTPWSASDP
jgi:hypothetical protein